MQFGSIYFIAFFLLTIIGYYVCPPKLQYVFLAISNAIFYVSWVKNCFAVLIVLGIIIFSYCGAYLLSKMTDICLIKRLILYFTILGTLSSLVILKYGEFGSSIMQDLISTLGWKEVKMPYLHSITVPVGISFYSLQAVGYVVDVYQNKTKVEKNIIRYFAFVTFLPTVISGPIERSSNLLEQLQGADGKKWKWLNIYKGFLWFIYGLFMKYNIADRISIFIDTAYSSYHTMNGSILLLAAIAYSLQIYCDFKAYSLMALGLGKMLGFDLIDNFNTPYLAGTIQDFWRRWHISLSTWFRDYIYIPFGGNRCSVFRKYLNLIITFLASGLWHGASWTYIVWGGIHGFLQIIGNITKKYRIKVCQILNIDRDCFSFRLYQKIVVFMLVTFAWIFFRADSLHMAVNIIVRIITHSDVWCYFDGSIYNMGIDALQMNILIVCLLVILIVDAYRYKTGNRIDVFLSQQNIGFQMLVIFGLLMGTFVFGMYGSDYNAQEFIYFQF